ncbi:hypothetical protein IHE45_09G037000 [Dioscorea alata]|uniref:Uncharacterized protein n=1 Tax=Dioscorea alata TaxID=55571 RepID=A0ACB7VEH5_DIOAL|nr:hypothetical protein IHE45_09G037000 [Dioscorea alata]
MHVESFGELVEILGDLVKTSTRGIIRLPEFEMTMTRAETNQKPVLTEDDAHIVTMYGRIYWLQLDRLRMLLYLYRFHRDAVVQQVQVPAKVSYIHSQTAKYPLPNYFMRLVICLYLLKQTDQEWSSIMTLARI